MGSVKAMTALAGAYTDIGIGYGERASWRSAHHRDNA
jgi:hypothetical protein